MIRTAHAGPSVVRVLQSPYLTGTCCLWFIGHARSDCQLRCRAGTTRLRFMRMCHCCLSGRSAEDVRFVAAWLSLVRISARFLDVCWRCVADVKAYPAVWSC
jgi:hypothetical protein